VAELPVTNSSPLIARARPVLDALRREGMYLSDRVTDEALALVGE